jgi:hypothetical protein
MSAILDGVRPSAHEGDSLAMSYDSKGSFVAIHLVSRAVPAIATQVIPVRPDMGVSWEVRPCQ